MNVDDKEFTDEELMQLYTAYLKHIEEMQRLEDEQRAYQWEQGLCDA